MSRIFSVAAALFALHCGGDPLAPNPDQSGTTDPQCGGQSAQLVPVRIETDTRLTADTRWLLQGQVRVTARATLTLEAGTTICGDATDPMRVSFLNVDQDAKLIAEGTADRPIVFTSSRPPGQRKTSDWGGVVLRGRAPINLPPGDQSACGMLEGNAGPYGPCGVLRSDDSSGVLRHVRIEFAGREVAPNNELNGLTLGGVGSGTVIDFVQVHRASDDSFEVFGGTVNLKHLLSTGGLDDAFDWDQGWRGKGQFWASQQLLGDGNNGVEADNNRDNNGLEPRSRPTLYNVTLIGTGRGTAAKGEKRFGLTLRQGTAGQLENLLVQGFADMGLVVTQESTCAELSQSRLGLRSALFYDNGKDASTNVSNIARVEGADCDVKKWALAQSGREQDPLLRRPYDHAAPDFRPRSGSPALTGAAPPPASEPFFSPADYVGAFSADDTDDWTQGWTAYPEN
jgi:hypothetical protein